MSRLDRKTVSNIQRIREQAYHLIEAYSGDSPLAQSVIVRIQDDDNWSIQFPYQETIVAVPEGVTTLSGKKLDPESALILRDRITKAETALILTHLTGEPEMAAVQQLTEAYKNAISACGVDPMEARYYAYDFAANFSGIAGKCTVDFGLQPSRKQEQDRGNYL